MRFNKNEAWSFGKQARGKNYVNENPGPNTYNQTFHGVGSPKWK